MWTCPVCDRKNTDTICAECGFDSSTDYEQYPTLQASAPKAATVSSLRAAYNSRNVESVCPCCGTMFLSRQCDYCNFTPNKADTGAETLQKARQHSTAVVANLTRFSIPAYRYAWSPENSRLQLQRVDTVELGDARDFFQRIVWADMNFGQLRSGSGTDMGIDITYFYKGMQRKVSCRIPTVRGDDFWRLGISLDASLHLKVYLGSGKNYIESAPIPLALT